MSDEINIYVEDEDLLIEGNEAGPAGGLTWLDADADRTLASGCAFRATNAAATVNLALPAAASAGAIIEVYGYGLGGFKITVPAGQSIHTAGTPNETASDGSGYIASVNQFDMVRLRCIVDNTDWVAEIFGCEIL